MTPITFGFLAILSVGLVESAHPARANDSDAFTYRNCLAKASRAPEAGYRWAQRWQYDHNGGDAARHCQAVALSEMDRFQESALLLQDLAQGQDEGAAERAAAFWAQAAQAWLRFGDLEAGEAAAINARQLAPDVDIYAVDLAQIYAEQQDHTAALEALNQAIELNPDNDDAFAFQASLLRRAGDHAAAVQAAERAVSLNPDNPSAALERGLAYLALQKKAEAREAFIQTATRFAGTPAGDVAQAQLEKMDVRTE